MNPDTQLLPILVAVAGNDSSKAQLGLSILSNFDIRRGYRVMINERAMPRIDQPGTITSCDVS